MHTDHDPNAFIKGLLVALPLSLLLWLFIEGLINMLRGLA